MTHPLRRALNDLAEEVVMVDLRDRTLHTSRQRTRRRRLWVSVTTAGAVMTVISAAALLWPHPGDTPPQPVGPTSQPTVTAPTASTTVTTPATPLTYLPGTAMYLTLNDDQLQVVRIVAGQPQTTTIGVVDIDGSMSATLSPDGQTVAYETGCEAPPGVVGDLVINRSAGGTPRTVANGIWCGGGPHPIWFRDSASLRVSYPTKDITGLERCGRMDVATGAFTSLGTVLGEGWCEYLAFSPDGSLRARIADGGHQYVIETAASVVVRYATIPPFVPPAGRCIQALSADGRYLALGQHNSDIGTNRRVRWIEDTSTGEFVPLATLLGHSPADGEELDGISFLADGGAVVATVTNQVFRWYLLSSIGVVTAIVDDAPGQILTGQFVYLP